MTRGALSMNIAPMDVAIEHRDVLERREDLHHLGTVAGEPFPFRLEVEQRTMGEDDDGGGTGKARQVLRQPHAALGTNPGLRARHIVEADKMYAAKVEG